MSKNNVFARYSVAIVTPFDAYDKNQNQDHHHHHHQPINQQGLESLIEYVSAGFSDARARLVAQGIEENIIGGIICSGTTGEQHSMSISERMLLYEYVSAICKRVNCPFAVGISATTIHDVITLALKAVDVGCDGIMLGLPPYLRLCQEEIIQYVESVRDVVPASIPILLYNNMMRNSYGATPETLSYLHQHGIIWGVKHASNDFLGDSEKIFSFDPSIKLYTGSDVLIKDLMTAYPSFKFYGITSILGNIFPASIAEMVADLVVHQLGEEIGSVSKHSIQQRQAILKELADAVLVGCTTPVGVKYGLHLKGIPVGETRRPIGHLSDAKKIEIESSIKKFDDVISTISIT